jgi:hypothetical protein
MKYNAIPTSCEAIYQVEDYTVNIVAGTADTTTPSVLQLTASRNNSPNHFILDCCN